MPGPTPDAGARQPLVLVVEDDESVRKLFVMNLELAGMATISAGDGQQALEILAEQHVDVVLLDAAMPIMDGHETLARIRATPRTATTTVIFVTGSGDVAARVEGLDAGADDYLEKPIDPDELVARVRAHLRGRQAYRRTLEELLGMRAKVAQALGRIPLEAPPVEMGAAVCVCLDDLAPGASSALVAFEGGDARLLAATGAFVPHGEGGGAAGQRLPRSVAERLRQGASTGPWIEQRRDQPPGALGIPLARTKLMAAAYVPLPGLEGPLGIIALAGPRARLDGDATGSLSAAVDLAPLVAALLRPALHDAARHGLLRAALRERIREERFTPVFQPIVELTSGRVVGFEALTRFADGAPPERVFTDATALGLGLELEAATAGAALAAASDALPAEAWLSVNTSPALVIDEERVAEVFSPRERPVVLELTEHDPIDDYALVRDGVAALRGDVRLSVDDAGAGYACLHHILELRPAFVKLDRGWVAGIDRDPARQALVAGLGMFADRTGGQLIAEGIEQPEELAILKGLGVPLGQGYLLGYPSPTGA